MENTCYFCREDNKEALEDNHIIPHWIIPFSATKTMCATCHRKWHNTIIGLESILKGVIGDTGITIDDLQKYVPEQYLHMDYTTNRHWTEEENAVLRTNAPQMTLGELQKKFFLDRSRNSIKVHLLKIGVKHKSASTIGGAPWSLEEKETLKANALITTDYDLQQKFFPNRSLQAIRQQRHILGLQKPMYFQQGYVATVRASRAISDATRG